MRPRLIDSHAAFRLLLALPAILLILGYVFVHHRTGELLAGSGEWAARLLILTLAVTPLRLLLRQFGFSPSWPMWLMQRRRDLGLAAFLYACFHLGVYAARQSSIHVMLYDLPYREYLAGWIALATMLALALTSNDWSVHRLGRWWKPLQRLTYASAIAVYLHWLWIRLDHIPALLHFLPLVVLEAYRVWHNFARPAGARN